MIAMMKLIELPDRFAVCRLGPLDEIPPWALAERFVSITRTDAELSILCAESVVPDEVRAETGWRCLMIEGPLHFDAVGVLSSIADPLALEGVSIFVVSTYDTDYLLVPGRNLHHAIDALTASGHRVSS